MADEFTNLHQWTTGRDTGRKFIGCVVDPGILARMQGVHGHVLYSIYGNKAFTGTFSDYKLRFISCK